MKAYDSQFKTQIFIKKLLLIKNFIYLHQLTTN